MCAQDFLEVGYTPRQPVGGNVQSIVERRSMFTMWARSPTIQNEHKGGRTKGVLVSISWLLVILSGHLHVRHTASSARTMLPHAVSRVDKQMNANGPSLIV